jgi:hypothetical protein
MRYRLMALLLVAPSAAAANTTIAIENHSRGTLTLALERSPKGHEAKLAGTLPPGRATAAVKPAAKILSPQAEAEDHVFDLRYVDEAGDGCRFRAVVERHSPAFARIVPVADAIGRGRCEASTGATRGDFVFLAR